MRLIPGKSKVQVELFKGVRIADIILGVIAAALIVLLMASTVPGKFYIAMGVLLIAVALIVRLDTEPNYLYVLHVLRYFGYQKHYTRRISERELLDLAEEEDTELPKSKDEQKALKKQASADQKAAKKAQKAEYKADEKILKSKSATKEEKDAIWLKRANQSAAKKKAKNSVKSKSAKSGGHDMKDIISFTSIHDNLIDYDGKYFGAAIEIPPVEFRFFSSYRRDNSIENGLGRVLRALPANYAANIVKIERTADYEAYLDREYDKLDTLKTAYENGFFTEDELKARVEILYDRINDLQDMCEDSRVVMPFYYVVLFDSDRHQLANAVRNAVDTLNNAEMEAHRLNTKELAGFLKYSNQLDFDEREIEKIDPSQYADWAMPKSLQFKYRTVEVNDIITHHMRIVNYPTVVGDAWLAGVMSMPATKVVVKCTPMDSVKAVKAIDFSLQELRAQYRATGVDSKRIELQEHINTLSSLLSMLQGDNEVLLQTSVYITCYDINQTLSLNDDPELRRSSLANIANLKRMVRRLYQESGMRLNNMDFDQVHGFIGAQISGWDPLHKEGRGIPSNSVAAMYPWIFAHIADKNGIKLGTADGVPVFIDFFRRDSERVNSNMVIVGKSGSGKSYATKSLLTNLAADNSKIFILDPENEYTELAQNLHGKFINVGNAQYGRLNPFHIITALDDDEDGSTVSGSYATHLQFLEEFFRQILPDCDKDAMEYLNSIIDRMYTNMGITADTDLSQLRPEDYPVFDDLYDAILTEFQSTDNAYIRTMLRTLMNYIAKFSAGGRNSNIWNGPSTVTTEENFTVFNFQSLLANRNGTIANAQMLLVLKYIDNEIIKNRDYNLKYHANRKVVVAIDEAHVFIDTKYPAALDFMYQLAKRIRKYNGMQIVITQNIKDFVGSEEIARKSTAIINACQYSFIFSLAPNDMDDLCRLYEKAGGINENEQEQIVSAPRGQAFTVMSPQSRSTFKITVPEDVVAMFEDHGYISRYFRDEDGEAAWEDFVGNSRAAHNASRMSHSKAEEAPDERETAKKHVTFMEVSEEEMLAQQKAHAAKPLPKIEKLELREPDEFPDIPDLPEDPEEFLLQQSERNVAAASQAPAAEISTPVPQPIQQPVQQPIPQVVVQAPPSSGRTEELLSELLTKFSYDSMVEEIRRSVRTELEKEMSVRAPQAASALAELPEQDDFEDDTGSVALGSIFNEDALAEAARLDSEEYSDESYSDFGDDSDDSDTDDEDGFDIMALLATEAERLGSISPIEMMETYDETVITVTLEELILYNKTH